MKQITLLAVALAAMAVMGTQHANAAAVASLNDWCFNVNGDVADLCNGGATPTLTGTVNGVGVSGNMDLTLASADPLWTQEAAQNNLGSASFVLGPGANQYVNAYMDYDLNYNNEGSYSDYGTVNGALPGGYSYEIDDPNSSNIFGDFSSNALTNQNNVGTFSEAPNPCCDVSWALGVEVSVANGYQDTVTFTVSDTAPASGFYLQQTNGIDTSQNIYLSATVTSQQVGPAGIPEPGTFLLLGAGLAGLAGWRVRARRQANV